YPNTEVVFVFRTTRRLPDCRFGWRWGPLWPPTRQNPQHASDGDVESLQTEGMLAIMFANLCEAIDLHLPAECEPGEIAWLP
ncbi:MAG: hypothetical protein ACRDRT_04655, partial [Pseudonocardiaceae bacterium]